MDEAQVRTQLGRAIAGRRKVRGLTQEQLAEAVGVSSEWVSQLERGVGAPSLEGLVRLAEALATDAPALLAAALDPKRREVVDELVAELAALDDPAVEVLAATARALRDRWPRSS
jgi:transcriptional regulator with XRE-family HTH domain